MYTATDTKKQHSHREWVGKFLSQENPYFYWKASLEISQTSEITGAKLPLHKTTTYVAGLGLPHSKQEAQAAFIYGSPLNNTLLKKHFNDLPHYNR